jgi:prevent-host-death family protein
MPQIGLRELSHHTAKIVDRVRHGETIEITDHGTPIFRMVPVKPAGSLIDRLVQQGRVVPPSSAEAPPQLLPELSDLDLGDLVVELRDEERY